MTRRTVLATVIGALLLGGLAAPALAGPLDGTSYVCLRTMNDPQAGEREGICVWLPVDPTPEDNPS